MTIMNKSKIVVILGLNVQAAQWHLRYRKRTPMGIVDFAQMAH